MHDGNNRRQQMPTSTTIPELNVALELVDGSRWIEIDSYEVACYAATSSQTAISQYYKKEEELEGGHPRRWFFHQGPAVNSRRAVKVALCVLPDGQFVKHPDMVADCHTTGRQNKNPYPEFAEDIEALAEATGLPIVANWQGESLQVAAASVGPKP
jgi:hypothetical protein